MPVNLNTLWAPFTEPWRRRGDESTTRERAPILLIWLAQVNSNLIGGGQQGLPTSLLTVTVTCRQLSSLF